MRRTPPKSINDRYPNITSLGRVTTEYGGQTRYEKFHPAVDIANAKGTKIPSPVSGIVEDAVGGMGQGNGYGNSVTIKDANGDRHKLSHLNVPYVRPGQSVQAGQTPIGEMGNSGSAYSPSGQGDGTHLDYRIVTAYGKYKNPMTYIKNIYGTPKQ